MKTYPFYQVDVFCASAAQPLTGNPVAVVMDAQDLSTQAMQQIARWTNLSETTFVTEITEITEATPASNAQLMGYKLRIFTPSGELPFAGHPTLGSAFAVASHLGLSGSNVAAKQDCAGGMIDVELNFTKGSAKLKLPTAHYSAISGEQSSLLAKALGCELVGAPQVVNLGPKWLTVGVSSGDALLALKPNLEMIDQISRQLNITGVNVFGEYAHQSGFEVRSFAPTFGVPEDPVCGSGNGAVAYYLRDQAHRAMTSYSARQGRAIERDGRIQISYNGADIWLGGVCVNCVVGTLNV
jgi:PhzF family phenazine biosynthesis protein